jgi:transketolase
VFAAGRSYDQIRQGICIPRLNVKIVGSSAGLSDFGDGSSHQAIEDVAIMRAIPNMAVLVPADGNETRAMTRAIASYQGPVYMRITRNDLPDVTAEGAPFEMGRPLMIRDGSDVVVFAVGQMVSEALKAADDLEGRGLSVRVVNVSTLKPVDEAAVLAAARGMKGIVTAEEHTLIGGLASLICFVFRGRGIPIRCVGIADEFGQSAHSYRELQEAYGLTADHIAACAQELTAREYHHP